MRTREDIRDYILGLEEKFPVNQWRADGLHLWPYIRIRLFFHLIRALGQSGKGNAPKPEPSARQRFIASLSRLKSAWGDWRHYKKWMRALPRKKFLFTDTDAHRVHFRGRRFNRYFDVLIDDYGIADDALFFDTDANPSGNYYRPDAVLRYQRALKGYLAVRGRKKIETDVGGLEAFLSDIEKDPMVSGFKSANTVRSLVDFHRKLSACRDFFTEALACVGPEMVFSMNYYGGVEVMALIAAANRSGIETVEMQHGPMTSIHLGYGSWQHAPQTGYDIIPRTFWCWDKDSVSEMESWMMHVPAYKARCVGNPWVDFWKKQPSPYTDGGFVLYTLQPEPVTLAQSFPPPLVKLIKESAKPWFLRLHPRQMAQRNELDGELRSLGISDRVVIDQATRDPLPLLLQHAALHVTFFSGAAIEAGASGCFTVLLDPIGKVNFAGLIADGKAAYLDPKNPDFIGIFNAHLNVATSAAEPPQQRPSDLFGHGQ
jgi:hypothetical protein